MKTKDALLAKRCCNCYYLLPMENKGYRCFVTGDYLGIKSVGEYIVKNHWCKLFKLKD